MDSVAESLINFAVGAFTKIPKNEKQQLTIMLTENQWDGASETQLEIRRTLQSIIPFLTNSNGNLKHIDKERKNLLHHVLDNLVEKYDFLPDDTSFKDSALISALIRLGLSAVVEDEYGNTPLGIAGNKQRVDLMRTIVVSSKASTVTASGETLLHLIISNYPTNNDSKYVEFIKLVYDLITSGCMNINTREHVRGLTPTHFAAIHHHVDLLKLFKEKGAHLAVRDYERNDLISIACQSLGKGENANTMMQEKTIEWLLQQTTLSVNSRNTYGYTALHYAAASDNSFVVNALLDAGADVNALAYDLTTPLQCAAIAGSFASMELLIGHGSSDATECTLGSPHGLSLAHLAAYSRKDARKLDLLARRGFDVNSAGEAGVTPLHIASSLGNFHAVEYLIAQGAVVNCREKVFGYTPLHLASTIGRLDELCCDILNGSRVLEWTSAIGEQFLKQFTVGEVEDYLMTVKALLGAGADVNAADAHGWTAMHFATRSPPPRPSVAVIRALLEADAYVDATNDDGSLPLHNVILAGNVEALELMFSYGSSLADLECHGTDLARLMASCSEEMSLRMILQAIQVEAAGFAIDDMYRAALQHGQIQMHRERCVSEVRDMKSQLLTRYVSIFDVLYLNWRQRQSFAHHLDSFGYQRYFPIYENIIQGSLRRAATTYRLFEKAQWAFNTIYQVVLPDLCIEEIFFYLENKDLLYLIRKATMINK